MSELSISSSKDIVFVRDLEVFTVIGVHDWERHELRPLILQLDIEMDNRAAAQFDALKDAVDYHAVSTATLAFARESDFQLVESFAEKLANLLLEQFRINWLRLEVAKPRAISEASSVGVIIERGLRD